MSQAQTSHTLLKYLIRKPTAAIGKKPPLLLLMHGVGSNEQDLFSLAQALPGKYLVVSARGPLTLGPDSYAWFQFSIDGDKRIINAAQAEAARKAIIQFIDDLATEQEFDKEQVYLMGFSQGGIMSYSVALTAPEKIKGIAVMSGRLLPEVKPLVSTPAKLKHLKVFISHGTADNVLPLGNAKDALTYLHSLGLKPAYHEYAGVAHTINDAMLRDVVNFLE